jgi:hypothetical protein
MADRLDPREAFSAEEEMAYHEDTLFMAEEDEGHYDDYDDYLDEHDDYDDFVAEYDYDYDDGYYDDGDIPY